MPSFATTLLHRLNGLLARSDLPPREPTVARAEEPSLGTAAAVAPPSAHRPPVDHLGPYAPLVDAIRDELGHFAASHVRLHLAIAERDRFLLTSIAVRSGGDDDARRLLQRFCREFRPEQVKRFLAREVVAGMPNADAIDLSRFEGLIEGDAARAAGGRTDAEPVAYAELLALLAVEGDGPDPAAWQVDVRGRWIAGDDAAAERPVPIRASQPAPRTPLAGMRQEFEVEDAAGRRRIVLQGVVPGRRYAVGTGDGADIRVDGTYASRRHAELWLDGGRWHVADAGSTNGVRLESRSAVVDPAVGDDVVAPGTSAPLDAHRRLVLSARAEGAAREYPTVAPVFAERPRSESGRGAEVPGTPRTPISPSISPPLSPPLSPPIAWPVAPLFETARVVSVAAAVDDALEPGHADGGGANRFALPDAARAVSIATVPRAPRTAVLPRPSVALASTGADADAVAFADATVDAAAGARADAFMHVHTDPVTDDGTEAVEEATSTGAAPRTDGGTDALVDTRATATATATATLPPSPTRAFRLTVSQAGGLRTVELDAGALPVSIGRSRTCTVAVDRSHDSVSGRHLEIVALEASGATVRVLGDNGLAIETVRHASGETVHWPWGAIAELAPSAACSLLLTRAWEV